MSMLMIVSGGDSVEEPNVDRHTLLEPQFMVMSLVGDFLQQLMMFFKNKFVV